MSEDFIKQLGYKALDSRLKRISDRMSHDIRKFYKELDLDVEPHWYLVFMILQKKKTCSLSDIADCLGYAHPSVVVMIKKMSEKGYLQTQKDSNDKRKQLVTLTEKAFELLPKLELIWRCCDRAILAILDENLSILSYVDAIDTKLEETSFHFRFRKEYLKLTTEKQ
ncbi:MAG: MarR family winged helix-turn-helix transcriptional regulator [Flavicella sp.]